MFHGSIPAVVQQMLGEVARKWGIDEIYVGTSGNFTVERTLAAAGDFKLHGNDVTLYSSIMGAYFAGQSFRCALKPVSGLEWLAEYMTNPEDRVATVLLASNLVSALNAKGEEKENEYYARLRQAYKDAYPTLHQKTVARIKTCGLKLASYFCGDVLDWMNTIVPPNAAFITYPPFLNVGAAKSYQNDNVKLNFLFDWDEPTYPLLDGERLKEYYHKVMDRELWVIGCNARLPELEPYLSGMARTTNRGVVIYVYESQGPKRIVVPRQEIEGLKCERLKPRQEIGSTMTIAPLTTEQFQAARSQYMNIGIRPGSATMPIAVLVDGYLVGVYAFSTSPHPGSYSEITSVYMLSDFPVAPTDYPRLSKLVLYAALSKESRLLAERITRHRINSVYTTAFSNRPASMKYRGIFTLHNRKENPTTKMEWGKDIDTKVNHYYAQKYELNYTAPIGGWSLAEGLAIWKQKHGERRHGNTDTQD